ncbi:helix-turn-helix domain-containing protein [Actinomadura alba]|uniref:Helix-turn-helix domain-containing protein n=1 Tax=Actinomadura alba TaxID=406431 RepID=A0ABR7LJP7_9ACTN|nr:helix-turn-helix domain-containing protein [Actinomadura alba]MBC6465080.1 helix-turn-helix domain-containing protein [Actinomadura alba]
MVGRPERPVDPSAGVTQQFAHQLRELRREAGLTYRELAKRSGCSVTTLSDAAGGERLPTLRVTVLYAEGCGADPAEWEQRWRAAAATLAARTREDGTPPYLGLATYGAENADRFFGRDRLVGELVDRLRGGRFLGVFGPSGSGKSSLLRAGLVPAAHAGRLSADGRGQAARVLTPGPRPLQRLPDLSDDFTGLVIVDQFEEVFTLCRDPGERTRFIDALMSAASARVVIGVRADFYGRCAEHPALVRALRDASLLVGPMSAGELREAIVKPASRDGLTVEPALVATIIQDAGNEPGALPHVSHALLETWRRRGGKALTVTGYEATGGVRGAVARTVEHVYGELSPERQRLTRHILLRLVEVGEGGGETRRRVERAELDVGEPAEVAVVLERLAGARLVSLGPGTAEIAHEALIGSWPRLRDWLSEDREGLRVHRRLTEAAATWQELNRDPGALLRGTRLTATQEWVEREENSELLTTLERSFLAASVAAERAELAGIVRRNRRLRGLAVALSVLLVVSVLTGSVAWRQREMSRSRQLAAEALAVAGTDVGGSARLALRSYGIAPTEEARSSLLSVAGHQPFGFRLAGHVGAVASVAFSPDGSLLASGGVDQGLIVWDLVGRRRVATLTGHRSPVQAVTFSPDGRSIASADTAGRVIIWDAARRTPVRTLIAQRAATVTGLGFSRDGKLLLADGVIPADGELDALPTVWAVATGRRSPRDEQRMESTEWDAGRRAYPGLRNNALVAPRGNALRSPGGGATLPSDTDPGPMPSEVPNPVEAVSSDGNAWAGSIDLGHDVSVSDPRRYGDNLLRLTGITGAVRALAFLRDGRRLVSGDSSGATILWDVHHQARIVALAGHSGAVNDVVTGPGDRLIASAGDDGIVVWDMDRMPLTGHIGDVTSVVFSPDGRHIATGGAESAARLWAPGRSAPLAELAEDDQAGSAVDNGRINAVAFSSDGRLLATGDSGAGRIWDVGARRRLGTLDVGGTVTGVAFAPRGNFVATGVGDGRVVLWDAGTRRPIASLRTGKVVTGDAVTGVAFSPDGRLLAASDRTETVTLFDVSGRAVAASLRGRSGETAQVSFSPDGRLLAAATGSGDVLLWDVRRRAVAATLRGHASSARAVAFSPDGRFLASGGFDHKVVVWDVAHRARWAVLSGHTAPVTGLAFSPDGSTLASASEDHTVIPWVVRPEEAVGKLCALTGRRSASSRSCA